MFYSFKSINNQFNTWTFEEKIKSDQDLNTQLYKKIDQWLELAKCYRSLANYDDVRGIFSQTPGLKPIHITSN